MTELNTPGPVPSTSELDAIAASSSFLSNLLLRPEAGSQVLERLDDQLLDSWPLPHEGATAEGLDALRRCLASAPTSDELMSDYRALFVGPGHMHAAPWESVHRSQEGLTFQEHTIQVRQSFAEFGLEAPREHGEPDDHIGLEFAFCGELAVAAINAHENSDIGAELAVIDGLRRFVDEHLVQWAPLLGDLVAEHATTDLYRAVGLLVRGTGLAMADILSIDTSANG